MSGMTFGENELRAICEKALKAADGDQAEATVVARNAALTRFANAAIHQNVVSREAELRVRVVRAARAASLSAAGYVATNVQELAIASSLGVWAYAPATTSDVELAAIGDAGSAFAQRMSLDVGTLDVTGCIREAIEKAKAAQKPRDLAPGTHEVVLEPYAVRDIVTFLPIHLTPLALEQGPPFVGRTPALK